MKKTNLVLIGMPGSGKSTCGILTAKALCKDFIDTDLLIQNREEDSLQNILNTKGPVYFAEAESRVLRELKTENSVISTGGSAVYYDEAMHSLQENGTMVYLRIGPDEMLSRIRDITTRGILLRPGETLEEMFVEREPLYEKYADIIIDCDSQTIEQTVEEICRVVANCVK